MKLSEVPISQTVKIKQLNCTGSIRRRLLDLGMVENTKITPILTSISGNPTAYEIRGSMIALRKEDSKNIIVSI